VICRSCGATIDAKAIICYRCGAPTADVSAPTRSGARPYLNVRLGVALLIAVGIVVYLVIHFAHGH
jgi:hypothetical protein